MPESNSFEYRVTHPQLPPELTEDGEHADRLFVLYVNETARLSGFQKEWIMDGIHIERRQVGPWEVLKNAR
jgi:hypothetical protein